MGADTWPMVLMVVFFILIISFIARTIGHSLAALYPAELQTAADRYISFSLGLALLLILAVLTSRWVTFDHFNAVAIPLALLWLLSIYLNPERKLTVIAGLQAGAFSLLCGATVLVPLFVFGFYNFHNDAFTYLVHADWLQTHLFSQPVRPDEMTPLGGQIEGYQSLGLRMGGSFLLSYIQGLFLQAWSIWVYPALIISAVASGSLALGFGAAESLDGLRPWRRIGLLALPSLSLGGIAFGLLYGFLPQTLRMSFAAAFLLSLGPMFNALPQKNDAIESLRAAIPLAVLFSGALLAYSEIAPLLVIATGLSLAYFVLSGRGLLPIGLITAATLLLTLLLMNTELARAYMALKFQSKAIVGSPVDWPLTAFFLHAAGMHGGAWDLFQWLGPNRMTLSEGALGFLLVFLLSVLLVMFSRTTMEQKRVRETMIPVLMAVLTLFCGILYFRYIKANPFPVGMGQSWSQFKLSDWAHLFVAAFLLLLMSKASSNPLGRRVTTGILIIAVVGVSLATASRMERWRQAYPESTNVIGWLFDIRAAVQSRCAPDRPVYLDLGGPLLKQRQMIALILRDRDLAADWGDDDYMASYAESKHLDGITLGDCVISAATYGQDPHLGYRLGHLVLHAYDGRLSIGLQPVEGFYDQESRGGSNWYWVQPTASFRVQGTVDGRSMGHFQLVFNYTADRPQSLKIRILNRADKVQEIYHVNVEPHQNRIFNQTLRSDGDQISKIVFESSAEALPLSENDSRKAAWRMTNPRVFEIRSDEAQ